MEKSKDRVIARWFNGKLAVLDITETGRQIGEKLAVLLNAEQQINLANYLLVCECKKGLRLYVLQISSMGYGRTHLLKFMRETYISAWNSDL